MPTAPVPAALADKLHAILLRNQPGPDDIGEVLSRPRNRNGGVGLSGSAAVGF